MMVETGMYVVMCLCDHRALKCSNLKRPNRRTSARTWSQWEIDAGGCIGDRRFLLLPTCITTARLLPACTHHASERYALLLLQYFLGGRNRAAAGLRGSCSRSRWQFSGWQVVIWNLELPCPLLFWNTVMTKSL